VSSPCLSQSINTVPTNIGHRNHFSSAASKSNQNENISATISNVTNIVPMRRGRPTKINRPDTAAHLFGDGGKLIPRLGQIGKPEIQDTTNGTFNQFPFPALSQEQISPQQAIIEAFGAAGNSNAPKELNCVPSWSTLEPGMRFEDNVFGKKEAGSTNPSLFLIVNF